MKKRHGWSYYSRRKVSKRIKNFWASMTPQERAERCRLMREGKRGYKKRLRKQSYGPVKELPLVHNISTSRIGEEQPVLVINVYSGK